MKFFEYGKENPRTLMILNGYLAKWYPGLMPFINVAAKKYHVIVQAYDGFNEDEPDTVFHSVKSEADMARDYIIEKLGGNIDILYGISMGGMVANEILLDRHIHCHTFIADGYTIMPMPVFRFKIVERIYVMAYSWLIYSVLTKHQGIMAATLGRTRESIDESLYVNASQESIRNSVISEIGYQYKFMSFNNTKSYILHGDAERFAAIKVHRLKKKGIHFKHKMFRNTGHAELIHKDPRILLSIIDKAYIDKL